MLLALLTYKDQPSVRPSVGGGVAVGELLCHCMLHLDGHQPETIPGGPVSSLNTSMHSPSLRSTYFNELSSYLTTKALR